MTRMVTVHGGSDDPGIITSVDRTYQLGATYLVFPVNSVLPFEDNICTATRLATEGIKTVDPFAEEPEGGESQPPVATTVAAAREPRGSGAPTVWAIAGAAAAAAVALIGAATVRSFRK